MPKIIHDPKHVSVLKAVAEIQRLTYQYKYWQWKDAEAEADDVLDAIKGLMYTPGFMFHPMVAAHEAFRDKCRELEAIKPFVLANI